MSYNAQIKEIHKLDRRPFGDKNNIYTYQITTTKHTGLLYTSELSVAEGDYIQYDYVQQKNGWKIVLAKDENKKPMYSNYTKQEQSVARLDTGRSILLQVAFKETSQAYIAGKISQDEVETLTNKYFNIIDK
jgi:hypothetical protein